MSNKVDLKNNQSNKKSPLKNFSAVNSDNLGKVAKSLFSCWETPPLVVKNIDIKNLL